MLRFLPQPYPNSWRYEEVQHPAADASKAAATAAGFYLAAAAAAAASAATKAATMAAVVIAQPFRAYVCDAIQRREQSSLGWLVHLQ
jgi:hypothetical protein